jgi:tagatose-6-phosphate ketose/aldose isomerase
MVSRGKERWKLSQLSELLKLSDQEKKNRGLLNTPREIAQQPDTWGGTFARLQKSRPEIKEFLRAAGVGGDPSQAPTVILVGAGTSDYTGRALVPLLRRMWKCEVIAVPSTDLMTDFPDYVVPGRSYLWISFSRSGQSPEGVTVLRKALADAPDIHHLVVTCNADGEMIRDVKGNRRAFAVLLDEAVNDRGLAMTSSFTNMVLAGQCLAHLGLANADSLDDYGDILGTLIEAGKSFLDIAADRAAELAAGSYNSACFVGSGPLKAVATESGLKLLELTAGNIRTVTESALGLRHGPMAVLDKETLFVCYLSNDECKRKYEADLLKEIGSKGLVRTRVAVGSNGKDLTSLAELVLGPKMMRPVADYYRAPVDIMFGQLLGLFFSMRCGLKPDTPSPTGAINRVVQGVQIYDVCSPSLKI